MEKLKPLDFQLLWELMKNSHRSDRQLAKVLNTSQPTVTRRRAKLEKEAIEGYTVLPKWEKIGIKIIAYTFIKSKLKYANQKERQAAIKKAREWFMKQPNVIFSTAGEGMGWAGLTISVHKSYSDYSEFRIRHDSELGDFLDDAQTFIANTNPTSIMKPLHFKYLANLK